MMERLTNEEVRVDESMDRYLGPRSVLECMKPKLLDMVLNGPVLNSVSKAALRQIIRQLYSALAAYEDTGLTPGDIKELLDVAASKTNKVLRLKEELHTIKNELCQYCGKCKHAHEGACDGCKWRDM